MGAGFSARAVREKIGRRTAIAHSYQVGRGAVHLGGGAVDVGNGVETHVLEVGLELSYDVVDAENAPTALLDRPRR